MRPKKNLTGSLYWTFLHFIFSHNHVLFMTVFGSTEICDYSRMKHTRGKIRTQISDEQLENSLRIHPSNQIFLPSFITMSDIAPILCSLHKKNITTKMKFYSSDRSIIYINDQELVISLTLAAHQLSCWCGPRQVLFFLCGPGRSEGWTPPIYTVKQQQILF